MKKNFIGLLSSSLDMNKFKTCVFSILVVLLFLGCLEQKTQQQDILDDIALSLDDLNGTYEILEENYITDPYVSDESKLFSGWNVLQKYRVVFLHNETDFIQHEIVQLQSENKAIEFQTTLTSNIDTLGYDFSSIDVTPIGNTTLLFQAETDINDKNVTIYLLTFSYDDLIVIIQTSNSDKEMITEYGTIVLNKILTVDND